VHKIGCDPQLHLQTTHPQALSSWSCRVLLCRQLGCSCHVL
jgi:hypothetical protein